MNNYLLAKARNTVTGQTVKQQDLTGYRYQLDQRKQCQLTADLLAESMTKKTGDIWVGFCEAYTPSKRR